MNGTVKKNKKKKYNPKVIKNFSEKIFFYFQNYEKEFVNPTNLEFDDTDAESPKNSKESDKNLGFNQNSESIIYENNLTILSLLYQEK